MVNNVTLPTVDVIGKRPAPYIPVRTMPMDNPFSKPYRATLPIINVNSNRGEFTSLVLMYKEIDKLNIQSSTLRQNIDYILGKLTAKEKQSFAELIKQIADMEKKIKEAEAETEKQFKLSMDQLRLWNIWNNEKYKTPLAKFDVINVTLSVLDSPGMRKRWEQQYGNARRKEIEKKQQLNQMYIDFNNKLNPLFMRKIYPTFNKFPKVNQNQLNDILKSLSAKDIGIGLDDNHVEILVSDSRIPSGGSEFGHVAVNIGGIVYGRAPKAWDIREKRKYIQTQQTMRLTRGYVLKLTAQDKIKLLASIERKIVENASYSILDHSCSKEIISSFADINTNIVDPRWAIGDVFSPADMASFLGKSKSVIKINDYPKK